MYFIVQIVISIFSMVPYIIGIGSVFTSIENQGSPEESLSFLSIMMVVFMCLAMLFSYILNNLLVVNSGIIYYSLREKNENRTTINDIDLIGTESE